MELHHLFCLAMSRLSEPVCCYNHYLGMCVCLCLCVCVCVCAIQICRRLTCDYEGVRPDIVTLGKALSGGTMPVSSAWAHSCENVYNCVTKQATQ